MRRFIQGLNLEIQETLAADQVNTFIETLEQAQKIENAKAQVKTFQARKRSAPKSTPEKFSKNVMPSKIRRADFPHYPPRTLAQLEGDSSRGVQIEKGNKRKFLEKVKWRLLVWLVDIVGRQITLRMNAG